MLLATPGILHKAVAGGGGGGAFTELAHTVDTANSATHSTTASVTSSNTTIVIITWSGSATLSGVTVGGSAATQRAIQEGGNENAAIYDISGPSTGSLTVQTTHSAALTNVGITVLDAGSLTHQASQAGTSGGANPETHTETINTTSGDSVVMMAVINNGTDEAMTATAGVDTVPSASLALNSSRRARYATVDSAAGGAPETFTVTWSGLAFRASSAAIGVYA